MPVDQQIREGLAMLDQKLPTPDTYVAYEQIVHEARTRTVRTRFLQAGLVAAAVAVVVATGQIGGTGLDPSPAPAPADRATASAPASVSPASGLDGWEDVAGTWVAEDVSIASMAGHLASLGRSGVADDLRRVLPPTFEDGVDLTVEFHLGRATLSFDGVEMDSQNYAVEGDATLYLRPLVAPGGRSRFAARIEDDQLRLAFLDTTVPSRDGISEELLLAALYTSTPFERVDF